MRSISINTEAIVDTGLSTDDSENIENAAYEENRVVIVFVGAEIWNMRKYEITKIYVLRKYGTTKTIEIKKSV